MITGNIINMLGIEKAFSDFVKRVSEKENEKQLSAVRGFQYGGGSIGYANGGRIGYESGGVGLPPVENSQPMDADPAGFSFDVNASGKTINPQLNYTGNNFGGNLSAAISPFRDEQRTYSGGAYFGPEDNRYTLGFNTAPSVGARQMTIGRQSPYGELSLGASKDPIGRNLTVNYNHRFADGGRVSYSNGGEVNPQGVETLFKKRYK